MTPQNQDPRLSRLLFVSQSTHPLGHISDLDIMRAASRHNKFAGISGVFLRSETWFCQVLEGRLATLEHVWSKIKSDPRHSSISVWWEVQATQRLFRNWHTEHWGVSPQLQDMLHEMLRSEDVEPVDKVTFIRAFAHVRRLKNRREKSGINDQEWQRYSTSQR